MVELNEDVVQDFDDFWDRGVHGGNWGGDTHILYQLGTSPTTINHRGRVTNAGQGGKHAEKKLIDKLKKRIARMDRDQCNKIFLSMRMNRSPCGDCAKSLIGFKNHYEHKGYNITITIKAAQPYLCQRITCSKCYWDWSGKHNRGLIGLNRNGISVNAWVWFDWQFLADYLNGFPCSGNYSVTLDYDTIFPGGGHGKVESRSMADGEAQKDFNALRQDALRTK